MAEPSEVWTVIGESLVMLPELVLASRIMLASPGRVTSILPVSLCSLYLGVELFVAGVGSTVPLKVTLPVPVSRCEPSSSVA